MTPIKRLVTLFWIAVLATGCATTGGPTTKSDSYVCFLAMTAGGTGAGAAIKEDEPAAIAAGMLIGGLLGYYFCDTDEAPSMAPVAEAPALVADSDGDGVNDDNDRCPNTPRGTRVDSSGCPLDSDGDGVTDNNDRCPNTPPGTRVDSSGCPVDGDNDGDGVANSNDKCPNTPAGQRVNREGCTVIFSLEGVNFAFDSDALTRAAETRLDEAVKMLRDNPATRVVIEGHTDSVGSNEYNQGLSERRASSVVNYLVANGIDRGRMSSLGRGESDPVAGNDTDEGRTRNRRVDFVVQQTQ